VKRILDASMGKEWSVYDRLRDRQSVRGLCWDSLRPSTNTRFPAIRRGGESRVSLYEALTQGVGSNSQ